MYVCTVCMYVCMYVTSQVGLREDLRLCFQQETGLGSEQGLHSADVRPGYENARRAAAKEP